MVFGLVSACSILQKGTDCENRLHHSILTVICQYAQLSEIAYQVDAAIDEFHAVHVAENGRREGENIVARDTIYKIGVEQRAFLVADNDRDVGKENR